MPELPEVETVRRGLEPAMTGARFIEVETRRPDLRFPLPPDFSKRLAGQAILSMGRRAKYLLADLSSGEVLVMHLGMTGRFLITAPDGGVEEPGEFANEVKEDAKHDHVVFRLSNRFTITYNDVRRFGFMDLVPRVGLETSRHFKAMGIEPLGNELSGETIARLFAGKMAPLKAALLDQGLIAGLGNIYVCEALHRASLAPERAAGTLTDKQAVRLAEVIREVLAEAVEAGGSTLKDYRHTDGSLGYFQHRFRVYDREGEACPTPDCRGTIERLVQSGRSTYWCRHCQK
ncbi:bifunctional DNA-formamidopyrimidine glycosylase/DNA-(apurinic or apyrimidinic site) lyase [Labrys sp. LIt4]|uniref:bifunctional DNA-formamidopyrimidine glycosylase/DNA-(apurinic or apyrimidinic site) lyase n=1 Tax=Labrys sp. LIt4 TaxID=2821355 RepID=UPI001AE04DEF|nr:bifunctional DNA-formamidopyrimidine glycosylase/DNA-(apurinic or apyrimidinic site) lyase [Labrys sp. LIt4]MBP0582186.1 bifunctional DNA-formamidopyrimidine glycosylase/DNA-(apurinic or apyrimidinic site) lyase [Labrys sp. LIt4]